MHVYCIMKRIIPSCSQEKYLLNDILYGFILLFLLFDYLSLNFDLWIFKKCCFDFFHFKIIGTCDIALSFVKV